MTGEASAPLDRSRVHRRLVAVALAVLPWLIAPGRIQPDTKVDLTVDPWTYLSRALWAWNDHAGLGELQNQAYGYLFPFGPVMGVAQSVGLPAWAAQRLWWSLLLLVAYAGAERLVRRLGVAGPGPALIAGLAYALSCRVLTVLSEISAEAWPLALAPWLVVVMVPAVQPAATRRARLHAAAATGLLTAALGGVNATASAVVLLLPLLLIVTAQRGGRVRALAWWVPGVVLGALWWVVPLVVLGRYAYPFLDFIETSQITTAVTSVPNVLRGASHWVAYILDSESHPVWQAGWVQAQDPLAIISTCVVAGLGAAGLIAMRRRGHRLGHAARFGIAGVVVGVLLMSIGHPGTVGSPVAGAVQAALDGPLAPLRNVHKADPVLRLPLVLGLAYVLGALWHRRTTATRAGVVAVALVLTASTTALWVGRAADAGGYAQIPHEWRALATTVDAQARADGGATLLLPASRNAHYTWGSATDEPLSALATSPVVVRASAPLGDPAATRLLDEADLRAASGRPQPGLAAGLARMGVARVVVRHDLATSTDAEPWRLVERTLAQSPGFERVSSSASTTLWRVRGAAPGVTAYDESAGLSVDGGPESLFGLAGSGLLSDRMWALISPGHGTGVLTDTLRRRAYNNGRPTADAHSPTLRASDDAPTRAGARDLPPAGPASGETVRELVGLRDLSASSSAADPFGPGYLGPQHSAAAALDGDAATSWISGETPSATLALTLDRTRPVGELRVRLARGAGVVTPDRVTIAAHGPSGAVRRTVAVRRGIATVDLGSSSYDRVSVQLGSGHDAGQVGVAELTLSQVPGIGTRLRLPGTLDASRQGVLLQRDARERSADARGGEDGPALRRAVQVDRAGPMRASVSVRPTWGPALDAVLDGRRVTGSSRSDLDPARRPGAALDADPATRWTPAPTDALPTLKVDLGRPTHVTGVRLSGGGPVMAVRVVVDGRVTRLPATGGPLDVRASTVELQLVPGPHRGAWSAPEITLDGVPSTAPSQVVLGCGQAGSLSVGGATVPLRVSAGRAEILSVDLLSATPCGRDDLEIPAGEVDVQVSPGVGVRADSVLLQPTAAAPATPGAARAVAERGQRPGLHEVRVAAGAPAVLALTEGANDGWVATTADGTRLQPVTVDGWRQGFRLPTTRATDVRIDFAPTATHRRGLAAGALAVVVLLVGFVLTRRSTQAQASDPDPTDERPLPAWVGTAAAVVAAGLVAGPAGVVVGIAAAVVPRRWIARTALAAMALAGVALATLGVVEQQSSGAVAGQLLGTLTLALLARMLWPGAPTGAPAARPAEQTPTPARSSDPAQGAEPTRTRR
ncbi:hypothetical protein VV01_09015 [Luteipulveratus halotolerans]|uniref:F5/8 type C domain-containing protein n=1 Tax=Luteipulveratus halotolerans TaxID=1631356 RepID=A0A0L6CHG9_9MICO|nr:hypothetical protein VV01_09015 [Luteipulveratus halotolerans]